MLTFVARTGAALRPPTGPRRVTLCCPCRTLRVHRAAPTSKLLVHLPSPLALPAQSCSLHLQTRVFAAWPPTTTSAAAAILSGVAAAVRPATWSDIAVILVLPVTACCPALALPAPARERVVLSRGPPRCPAGPRPLRPRLLARWPVIPRIRLLRMSRPWIYQLRLPPSRWWPRRSQWTRSPPRRLVPFLRRRLPNRTWWRGPPCRHLMLVCREPKARPPRP